MEELHSSANKIQTWWKKNSEIIKLRKVILYLKQQLDPIFLQEFTNKCLSIVNCFKGDGAGLTQGTLIDRLICEMFKKKLDEYCEYHQKEADIKICEIPLSEKKISGKSIIALDWSKNEQKGKRKYFECSLIIINLKTEQWWKKNPTKRIDTKIIFTEILQMGIYLVDKNFCQKYIILKSNNKTNTLIENQYLYKMLIRSKRENLFIPLPENNEDLIFELLGAFSKKVII